MEKAGDNCQKRVLCDRAPLKLVSRRRKVGRVFTVCRGKARMGFFTNKWLEATEMAPQLKPLLFFQRTWILSQQMTGAGIELSWQSVLCGQGAPEFRP